jgi:nucleoredoxin
MAFIIPEVGTLQRGKDSNVPIAELERDVGVIGLYFSAHWCPPCRGFTPKLAEWYTNLTDGPLKGKLEIVFISSDRDQAAFEEYFESMPWLALPFELRDAKVSC